MQRIDRHKRIKDAFLDANCTFEPQLIKHSGEMSTFNSDSNERVYRASAAKKAAKRLYMQAEAQQRKMEEMERRRDNCELDPDCTFTPLTNQSERWSKSDHRSQSAFSRRSRSDAGQHRSMVLYQNYYRMQDNKRKLLEDEEIRIKYEQRDPNRRNQKSEAII